MTKEKLRLAFGAPLLNFTDGYVKQMAELGATELILTSPDLEPHPDFVFLAKKYDCKAGYDMEYAIWSQYNAYLDLSQPYYQEKFATIKNVGYDFAISEGLFNDMPLQIKKSGLPYYNMGGEDGANMHNQHYGHPSDSHDANYPETYHSSQLGDYFNTYVDYYSKCKTFGLTFQVYQTADLELEPNAMLHFMDQLEQAGIQIGTVHFWAGVIDTIPIVQRFDPNDANGFLYPLYNALKTTYGFIRDIEITPPEPPKSLDELLGSVKETIAPARLAWHVMSVWDDKKQEIRLAPEQGRIQEVKELWEHLQNRTKADKLEIREHGDVYYFGNDIWYTKGNGWCKY